MNVLGVSKEVLDTYGAVSQECAEQMAAGARRVLGTDYAIATTGIAGPDGGTAESLLEQCGLQLQPQKALPAKNSHSTVPAGT